MFDRLPELFDPLEFAEKKRRIKGSLPLERMDRLRDALLSEAGEARIDLEFRREEGFATVRGRVDADPVLQCQCCMEALVWPVRGEVRLGIVGSLDEADRLPEAFEPLLAAPGASVALLDIVQDELLLAIPSIPQHAECGPPKPERPAADVEHPFAVLAQLKKSRS